MKILPHVFGGGKEYIVLALECANVRIIRTSCNKSITYLKRTIAKEYVILPLGGVPLTYLLSDRRRSLVSN